jgi:uncharacterized protein (DUF1697 family)
METLVKSFGTLGLAEVESVIASGNILFTADGSVNAELEARIEKGLESDLGYAVPTFLRSAAEMRLVAEANPFGQPLPQGGTDSVMFLKGSPKVTADRLAGFESEMDRLALVGAELHWRCRGKTLDSKIKWPKLVRELGLGPNTTRNRTTVVKLADRLAG